MASDTSALQQTNRYNRMEVAGPFGDLGTLIPFVVAYLAVLKMDPYGVLFAFSLAMLVCGLVADDDRTLHQVGDAMRSAR